MPTYGEEQTPAGIDKSKAHSKKNLVSLATRYLWKAYVNAMKQREAQKKNEKNKRW